MQITQMRIGNTDLTDGLWIDVAMPTFSFAVTEVGANEHSVPYTLQLFHNGKCIWKKSAEGDDFLFIPYTGTPLESFCTYVLVVHVKEMTENRTFYTAFTKPFLQNWITAKQQDDGAAPLFQFDFNAKRAKRALLVICGLGFYDATLNKKPVTDTVLNPPHTMYDKNAQYRVFDVTPLLKKQNRLQVTLGNGFYNEQAASDFLWHKAPWRNTPRLFAQIRITEEEDKETVFQTDESWLVSTAGPLRYNSIYFGEHYDARKEKIMAQTFLPAVSVPVPARQLRLQTPPFIQRCGVEPPERIKRVNDLQWVVKARHTTAGWLRLVLSAKEGTAITLHYTEKTDECGVPYIDKSYEALDTTGRGELQTDVYLCKGATEEIFEPQFSYKGFLYVHITSSDVSLQIHHIDVVEVHNQICRQAQFTCSEPLLCKTVENMERTLCNNFHGKPTDTPLYEKNGWLGDVNVSLDAMFSLFDVSSFLESWLVDIQCAQRADGLVPVIVPTGGFGYDNDTVWTSAYIFIVSAIYKYTGNKAVVLAHYDALCRLANNYICRLQDNNWLDGPDYLADWVPPSFAERYDAVPPENSVLVGSAYSFLALQEMKNLSVLLGDPRKSAQYAAAAEQVRSAICAHCFVQDAGCFSSPVDADHMGTRTHYRQVLNLVPCAFGIARGTQYEQAKNSLLADVRRKNCLDVGMVGMKYILPFLSETGNLALAYHMATKTEYPGIGYWIACGADTMWEAFEATARSHDHFFLGTAVDWIFAWVAGVRDVTCGYRTCTIAPAFSAYITQLTLTLQTPRGALCVSYEENGTLYLKIPFGTTATVLWQGKTQVCKGGCCTMEKPACK